MKTKTLLTLFSAFLVVFFSCSSDDDNFIIPEVPGQNMEEGEIQIVYNSTEDGATFKFNAMLDDSEESEIEVNWGDNRKLKSYSSGEISYPYPLEDGEYVITIKTKGLKEFSIKDVKTATRLKSFFLGNCPMLENFYIYLNDNQLENFDITSCPSIGKSLTFKIYRPNFNFDGLKNVKSLSLEINQPMSVKLDDFECSFLHVYMGDIILPSLHINKAENLKNLQISGWRMKTSINDFKIEASSLDQMRVNYLTFTNDFNLKSTSQLKSILLNEFDCLKNVTFNDEINKIEIYNYPYGGKKSAIEKLDFTNCIGLKGLYIQGLSNLREVNLEGLPNLEYAHIIESEYMDDYHWSKKK